MLTHFIIRQPCAPFGAAHDALRACRQAMTAAAPLPGWGRAHPDIVSAHRLLFQGWQLVFLLLSTDRVFASGNLAFFNTPVCEGVHQSVLHACACVRTLPTARLRNKTKLRPSFEPRKLALPPACRRCGAKVNGRGRRSTKFAAARHRVAAIRLDIRRLPFDNRNRRRIDIAFPNGGRGAR